MGHLISYHTAESMETEVASDITENGHLLPDMLLNQIGLATGVAWDNYDELTETLSSKNTVGICYQNKPAETVMEQTTSEQAVPTESSLKRRRQFDAPERHVVPYKRRPSISKFRYELYSEDPPASVERAKKMNLIWMVSCHLMYKTTHRTLC